MTDEDDFSDTNFEKGEQPQADAEAPKFFEAVHPLPEALYLLPDGSYGDRQAFDAEQDDPEEDVTLSPEWGKGALLLNPSTKSYLTPFGFKALFKQRPKVIRGSFERAGLDVRKYYFQPNAPDILIHCEDGRFVPPSHLPREEVQRPLPLRFKEEDIYLQNFNHEGTKRTGSYISYVRAGLELRERHAEALQGLEAEKHEAIPDEGAGVAAGEKKPKRSFKFRPRTRGLSRRSPPSAGKHS